jgi:hypothetical protein
LEKLFAEVLQVRQGRLLQAMIFARILFPCAKLALVEQSVEQSNSKRLTNYTVYGDRYFRATQALGVSSATRLFGKSAKPGSTAPR